MLTKSKYSCSAQQRPSRSTQDSARGRSFTATLLLSWNANPIQASLSICQAVVALPRRDAKWCYDAGAAVQPVLRAAEVLRALVLPAARSWTVALHSRQNSQNGATADLRLALQLGIQSLPLAADENEANHQHRRNPNAGDMTAGVCTSVEEAADVGGEMLADRTADELLSALFALLDARPSAESEASAAAAGRQSDAASGSNATAERRITMRQIELTIELSGRLIAAVTAYVHAQLRDMQTPDAALDDGRSAVAATPLQGTDLLAGQLHRLCLVAETCSWRTALCLAPLEPAMRLVCSDDAIRDEQQDGGIQKLASGTHSAQQAVTECLVLCASSAEAARAFVEVAGGAEGGQAQLAAPGSTLSAADYSSSHSPVQLPGKSCSSNSAAVTDSKASAVEASTAAVARLVLALPRRTARAELLASCLSLLPWCTATEYARLTRTALPAWLAALQRQIVAIAASAPGSAAAGVLGAEDRAAADVLQLCARVASLLARDDAPMADADGGRVAAVERMLRNLGTQCQHMVDRASGRSAVTRRCTQVLPGLIMDELKMTCDAPHPSSELTTSRPFRRVASETVVIEALMNSLNPALMAIFHLLLTLCFRRCSSWWPPSRAAWLRGATPCCSAAAEPQHRCCCCT